MSCSINSGRLTHNVSYILCICIIRRKEKHHQHKLQVRTSINWHNLEWDAPNTTTCNYSHHHHWADQDQHRNRWSDQHRCSSKCNLCIRLWSGKIVHPLAHVVVMTHCNLWCFIWFYTPVTHTYACMYAITCIRGWCCPISRFSVHSWRLQALNMCHSSCCKWLHFGDCMVCDACNINYISVKHLQCLKL